MQEFLKPFEKRLPCVFLVDSSDCVSPDRLAEVNQGLLAFVEKNYSESVCAEICVILFHSEVEEIVPFCPADHFRPVKLQAGGQSAMNQAIIAGLDAIKFRKNVYREMGIDYWRPRLILLSNGSPTDDAAFKSAAMGRLQLELDHNRVMFLPICSGPDANIHLLREYTQDGAGMVLDAAVPLDEAFKQICLGIWEPYYSPHPGTISENDSLVIEL